MTYIQQLFAQHPLGNEIVKHGEYLVWVSVPYYFLILGL